MQSHFVKCIAQQKVSDTFIKTALSTLGIEVIPSQHEFFIWCKTAFQNKICIKRQHLTAQYSTAFNAVLTYLMSEFLKNYKTIKTGGTYQINLHQHNK